MKPTAPSEEKQPSRFRITARSILELGSELISSDIIAFYELIKNGFDAGTRSGVEIRFNIILRRNVFLSLCARVRSGEHSLEGLKKAACDALNVDAPVELRSKARQLIDDATDRECFMSAVQAVHRSNTIVVSDTGSGMSMADLTDNFLVIGTPSRKREIDRALERGASKSPFLGEKGIGRLSAMRLGNHLRVETARRQDNAMNLLEIDWTAFDNLDAMLDEIDVRPQAGDAKSSPSWSGTNIVVSDLAEDWTAKRVVEMAKYDFARLTDPFLDQKGRPRIVIIWNGERLTIPWMDQRLIDNAHLKIVGEYQVEGGVPQLRCKFEALDLGFEHSREIEHTVVLAHDLESAVSGTSQDVHDSALVTLGPFSFEAHWYNRLRLSGIDGLGELKAVRELQRRWSGILLFRDGFRVFPYGDDEDDWLALDRKAMGRSGYTLNKAQFIGRVQISRTCNPALVDQTNREGLRETPEQYAFLRIMEFVIQELLLDFMRDIERRYKGQKIDLSTAKSEVDNLESRAKAAFRRLRRLIPKEGQEAVDDLQQAFLEFHEFAERARQRIDEVEQESRQLIDMAGVGLMVEVVAHELARASENAIENIEALRSREVPADVRAQLESLRAQMKSLSKRVRMLDPLSVSARQRSEVFNLAEVVTEARETHAAQFQRHGILLKLDLHESTVHVRAVKGMIVQVVENLISNSKYWLQMRKVRDGKFIPTITITVHDHPPTIILEDNGRGVAPENRDKIFRAFFSLKEKSKRRGLGLFIARENAEFNGGKLMLDSQINPETERLHRFILELPERSPGR